MDRTGVFSLEGKTAMLATMHGKALVIKPLLEGGLGLKMRLPDHFDTDRFGTFSREIERKGSQLDAARAKIVPPLSTMQKCVSASPTKGVLARTPAANRCDASRGDGLRGMRPPDHATGRGNDSRSGILQYL